MTTITQTISTISAIIDSFTAVPERGTASFNTDVQTFLNEIDGFVTDANAVVSALNTLKTQLNTLSGQINTVSGEVNGYAASAASDAAIAASYADSIIATSTSSVLIGTGTKTFTVEAGKQFAYGQFVTVVRTGYPTYFMCGAVTSYSGTTLTISVPTNGTGGSGTYASWSISVSGIPGPEVVMSSHGNEFHTQTFITAGNYATSTTGGTVKARLNGTTAYFTTNGNNA